MKPLEPFLKFDEFGFQTLTAGCTGSTFHIFHCKYIHFHKPFFFNFQGKIWQIYEAENPLNKALLGHFLKISFPRDTCYTSWYQFPRKGTYTLRYSQQNETHSCCAFTHSFFLLLFFCLFFSKCGQTHKGHSSVNEETLNRSQHNNRGRRLYTWGRHYIFIQFSKLH